MNAFRLQLVSLINPRVIERDLLRLRVTNIAKEVIQDVKTCKHSLLAARPYEAIVSGQVQ